VTRLLRNRKFQFALILPNQLVFWLVVISGFAGTVDPGLNFGTAITWYLWFCLVFVMMVVAGRAWCAMCPFGGFAEWLQRRTFWQRTQKTLGLGLKVPEPVARYGFVLAVGTFLLLTWIEEFFNIAGPGQPMATSWMVIGIVATAVTFFLVFERRSFCRYFCPLTALIGSVGAMGSVAGFRTRDREVCVSCTTKDCMRGNEKGYGCPWYTWPGSAETNLSCGLCTECFKTCPSDNVGLFVQRPLSSVITPHRRRADVAWSIVLLWGLVLYQQLNSTSIYTSFDSWLNGGLHFPHYPDPAAYVGIILGASALFGAGAWVLSRFLVRRDIELSGGEGTFVDRKSRFRALFLPLAYCVVPVVGADYFARQLPKFFEFVPRLIPAIGHPFGFGSAHSALYNTSLLGTTGIVTAQVVVIALGTAAALWATWRIGTRELVPVSGRPVLMRAATMGIVLVSGAGAISFYLIMHAAT
jgi:polyferredoxin